MNIFRYSFLLMALLIPAGMVGAAAVPNNDYAELHGFHQGGRRTCWTVHADNVHYLNGSHRCPGDAQCCYFNGHGVQTDSENFQGNLSILNVNKLIESCQQ